MVRAPTPLVRALHVLVLLAFSLAQPVFDQLAHHVEFLVAHHVGPGDLLLLTFALTLGVPGGLVLAKAVVESLVPRASHAIHWTAVGLLAAAIALPPLDRVADRPAPVLVVGAIVLGAAFAAAYARRAAVRKFVTVLSPALLVFPLFFLLDSSIAPLLFPAPTEASVGRIESETPVVLIVFDALPISSLLDESAQIDAARYPHFARVVEEAHWFRNATTVAERTNYALPAILTGRYPTRRRPANTEEYPENLFTLLAPSYDLHVIEPATHLCPDELCGDGPARATGWARARSLASDLRVLTLHVLLPEEWTGSLPSVMDSLRDFGASAQSSAETPTSDRRRSDPAWLFSQFLDGIKDRGRPTLHFAHVNLPHHPFHFLPSGKKYDPGARDHHELPSDRGPDEAWETTQNLQRHLLQLGYVDVLVGRLRDRLESEGLYDRALVVITADHGESFQPGLSSRDLEPGNASDILLVPLFVKLPGQREGRVSDRPVETIDILPTIVEVLGGALPKPVDGRSLFGPSDPSGRTRAAYLGRKRWKRVRVEVEASLPSRDASVRRIFGLFDAGAGWAGLYAVGPHRGLTGRPVADLPVIPAPLFKVYMANRFAYDEIDPESRFVPARVSGSIEGAGITGERLDLAIAVNGVIRAVTVSYGHADHSARFSAMVPEESFQPRHNQIEVLIIRRDREGLTLLRGNPG